MWHHMLYETKQIETMTFGKSVIALFSKIESKNVKVRHEKVAKNRQKWVQIFFGMSHMLNNDICNIFLFFTFFLLVLSRSCF